MKLIGSYRNNCMQALVLSQYTKPGPYTIETLIFYMEGEFIISNDDQVHLYLLIGNIIRLSLRMGLHRDATKVGGSITPFQAEMRRRVWHHIGQIDLLGSFQIGLPGMFEAIDSDTLYPRNLREEDFEENSTEIPPSRPDSELTPTSYLVCKSRLTNACAKISKLANALTPPSYDEVMKMDKFLLDAYLTIPPFFQISSEFTMFQSPDMIIKQFSMALVFQKSRCMLHRKFVLKEDKTDQYSYSKKSALDASMELLRCQAMSYDATLDGGPLAQNRWIMSTLAVHDFLLASMIVSLNIVQTAKEKSEKSNDHSEVEGRMVEALERSYHIFIASKDTAAEANKASALLRAMLNKVYRAFGRPLIAVREHIPRPNASGNLGSIGKLSLNGKLSYAL